MLLSLLPSSLRRPPAPRTSSRSRDLLGALSRAALIAILGAGASAQDLVYDTMPAWDPYGSPSWPTQAPATVGSQVFFAHYSQLWVQSSPGAEPTQLASFAAAPNELLEFRGQLYFTVDDGTHGIELWRSNGTPSGTVLVADINVGSASSDPRSLVVLGDRLYFVATTAAFGSEIWSCDGTTAALWRDFGPGAANGIAPSGAPPHRDELRTAGGLLFFSVANSASNGFWRTDGTVAGTFRIRERPLWNLKAIGTRIAGIGSTGGFEPQGYHISDGTASGTYYLGSPGAFRYGDRHICLGANNIFFLSSSTFGPGPGDEAQIFVSDGSATGSAPIATDIGAQYDLSTGTPELFMPFGSGVLFYRRTPQAGVEPWFTDGTASGTFLLRDVLPGPNGQILFSQEMNGFRGFFIQGGAAYFCANDGVHGEELWRTDGTVAGTILLSDLLPGTRSAWPWHFAPAGNDFVFQAHEKNLGRQLHRSNGTALGTRAALMPSAAHPEVDGGSPLSLRRVGDRRITFSSYSYEEGEEPWMSDGTDAGTYPLGDLYAGAYGSGSLLEQLELNGTILLITEVGVFASDGTRRGTREVYRVNHGWIGVHHAVVSGGRAFFLVGIGSTTELWTSDGTNAGTFRVMATGGKTSGYRPLPFQNGVIFQGQDAATGNQLWFTDGTPAGTRLIVNHGTSTWPRFFQQLGPRVVYHASVPPYGQELWSTDGTASGTAIVRDVNARCHEFPIPPVCPGPDGGTFGIFSMGSWAIFNGWFHSRDGSSDWGAEPSFTDGTPGGTYPLANFEAGAGHSNPFEFRRAGTRVAFLATQTGFGLEVFISDGTSNGTLRLRDIRAGSSSAFQGELELEELNANGEFAFIANDGIHGLELWRSDGTPAGTQLWMDLAPGPENGLFAASNEYNAPLWSELEFAGAQLFYSGRSEAHRGRHLHRIWRGSGPAPEAEILGEGCAHDHRAVLRTSFGPPVVGNSAFRLDLLDATPSAPAFVMFSLFRSDLRLGPCVLIPRLDGLLLPASTNAHGEAAVSAALPASPEFAGLDLYFQALVLEPSGPVLGGMSFSNGLRVRIGAE